MRSSALRVGVSGVTKTASFSINLPSAVVMVCCSAARWANVLCSCWRDWLSRLAMYCVQKRWNTGLICIRCRKSSALIWKQKLSSTAT